MGSNAPNQQRPFKFCTANRIATFLGYTDQLRQLDIHQRPGSPKCKAKKECGENISDRNSASNTDMSNPVNDHASKYFADADDNDACGVGGIFLVEEFLICQEINKGEEDFKYLKLGTAVAHA